MGNEPHSSSGVSTLESCWTKQNRITLNTRHAEFHKSQYKVLTRHRHLTKDYQRTMFWVTAKGELHRELSKRTDESLRHLSRCGAIGADLLDEGTEAKGAEAKGAGAGRIRDMSLGGYSFAFAKLLHFCWASSIGGAHLLPIHPLTM
jgi:hypothetical protein